MIKTILELKCIDKSFFSKKNEVNYVLRDLSLAIETNTVNCIIGGNGSGKTTLFNLISGLEDSSNKKGQILFNEKDISDKSANEIFHLGIARMFQGIQVYDSLSILDNMLLQVNNQKYESPLRSLLLVHKIKKEENDLKEKALKVLEDVFNEESIFRNQPDTLAVHLSFGQKRLLSLVSLIMGTQGLILLDEPTSGVNPSLVKTIEKIVLKLKSQGKTVVIIEHNMKFVDTIADKVIFLNNKRMELEGTAQEILSNKAVIENYLGY